MNSKFFLSKNNSINIYILIPIFIIFLNSKLRCENISLSIHNFFLLGERSHNDVITESMGGVSTAYLDPLKTNLNFSNPASNSKLYKTLFNASISNKINIINYKKNLKYNNNIYFSNISFGFPIGKKYLFGISFQPYDNIYNNIYKYIKKDENIKLLNEYYSNNGDMTFINSFLNYNINKKINIGLSSKYIFGSMSGLKTKIYNKHINKHFSKNYKLKGIIFTFGFLYKDVLHFLNSNNTFKIGVLYNMGNKIFLINKLNEFDITNYYKKNEIKNLSSIDNIKVPSSGSFGFFYGKKNKWEVGLQFDAENKNILNFIEGNNFKNEDDYLPESKKISFGGYWISKNIKKIIYRSGIFYQKYSLTDKNNLLKYGISFGLGIPINNKQEFNNNYDSSVNIGLILGVIDNKYEKKISLKENFFHIKLGVNLGGKLFQKKTYD